MPFWLESYPGSGETLWLEDEEESGSRLCTCWSRIFEALLEEEQRPLHETILRHVQKELGNLPWTMDRQCFDDLNATKKEFAPDPDGIPDSFHRCAGGLGSQFLFNAYEFAVEGGDISQHFAASRIVFIAKSAVANEDGKFFRSRDALRPLTLCNYDYKIITSAMRHGRVHLSFSEMRCYQAAD